MEEKDLLAGLKASQITCYEKLIGEYALYITRVVRKVAGNRLTKEDVEEISADVFIKLWEGREEIKIKRGYLKSYLGAMARNKTLNKLRSIGGYECIPLEEDEVVCHSLSTTPEMKLLSKENTTVINEVVRSLPEPDREIFIRRYFYMEQLASIGKRLELPIGTVGTKLFRGKKKLEQKLKERGVAYE